MKKTMMIVVVTAACGSDSPTGPGMVNNSGLDGSVADAPTDGAIAALGASEVLLSFGTVLTHTRSQGLSTMISNQGGSSVISSLVLGGAGAAAYVIDSETCVGTALSGASTCAAQIKFAPTAAGAFDALLTVNGSASGVTTVVLKGTGVPAGALAISPSAGMFGAVTAGMSGDVSFGLQNSGTTPSGAITVVLSGADADLFQVTANNCAGGLAASGSCSLTVRFSPIALGAQSATLSASDAAGGAVNAQLSGTGI